MFVCYFDFLHPCFLHTPAGKQMQPRGRRQILCSQLAAGVSEPTSGSAVVAQVHGTTLKAAVSPPSHSATFPSPVLGREVNPGPAASLRLCSGGSTHATRAGAAPGTLVQFSGWTFSRTAHCVALMRQLFLAALLYI